MARLKLGVQISGRGSNLQALIDACANPSFPAEIAVVISNIADAYGLERAKAANIPTAIIPHKNYPTREAFEEAVDAAHRKAGVELVCLAGFMRIITPWFVARWKGKMINIHPSLLPAHKGLHTHAEVLAAGEKLTGCTVHFVDEGVDTGGIILQAQVPVESGDTEESLAARVLEAEHRIYPEAVKMIATKTIRYESGKVIAALLLVFSLLAGPAFAEVTRADELKIRETLGLKAEVFSCKTSDECMVSGSPHCGPSFGIRPDHKAEVLAAICKIEPCNEDAAGCDSAAIQTPYAICDQGECWADYERMWKERNSLNPPQ